ncbi:YcxB family protein [Anoxynatronum buryatiense]|uniref:YcxB-like protein n=1 Tax=Anoxynatronum buryatiense TaxID=489973 RepID=A0AA46AJ47_9CLOT|nr:YcxB family protein [Anoxynatronum buryatiense]SMP58234.1 YcxB-like protein [Anoxynatronum buryatiense]
MEKSLVIRTTINAQVFRQFSYFNAFQMNHRGLMLLFFPVFLIILGVIHLNTGSRLFFYAYCGAGLLLPALYLTFYHVSLKRQIRLHGLDTPRVAYTVTLDPHEVQVVNAHETTTFQWHQVYRVFHLDHVSYLYLTKARAFILPHGDFHQGTPEALIKLVDEQVPVIRVKNKRPQSTG